MEYKFTKPTIDLWVPDLGHVRRCIDCEQLIVGGMARCVRCCVEGPPRERVIKDLHLSAYRVVSTVIHFPLCVITALALYSHVNAPVWLWAVMIFEKLVWVGMTGHLFLSSKIKDKDSFDWSEMKPKENPEVDTSAATENKQSV